MRSSHTFANSSRKRIVRPSSLRPGQISGNRPPCTRTDNARTADVPAPIKRPILTLNAVGLFCIGRTHSPDGRPPWIRFRLPGKFTPVPSYVNRPEPLLTYALIGRRRLATDLLRAAKVGGITLACAGLIQFELSFAPGVPCLRTAIRTEANGRHRGAVK